MSDALKLDIKPIDGETRKDWMTRAIPHAVNNCNMTSDEALKACDKAYEKYRRDFQSQTKKKGWRDGQ